MTTQPAVIAGQRSAQDSPPGTTIVFSEYPLNRHDALRAEVTIRDGKAVVALSRWKNSPTGARRTGQAFEFGAHRLHAVMQILADVARMGEIKGGTR